MYDLYLFVEGLDDERFFSHHYSGKNIKIVQYSCMSNKSFNGLIRTLNNNNMPYLLFADSDEATIEDKKKKVKSVFTECEVSKIIIVYFEIESWYLAGLNIHDSQRLKVRYISPTDSVTKERFKTIIPRKMTRIDFMLEILEHFDIDTAKQRNTSFSYFCINNYA